MRAVAKNNRSAATPKRPHSVLYYVANKCKLVRPSMTPKGFRIGKDQIIATHGQSGLRGSAIAATCLVSTRCPPCLPFPLKLLTPLAASRVEGG